MTSIICENDLQVLLDKIQEHINKGSKITCMRIVDQTERQIVLLISDKVISQEIAEIWWSGFTSGLHEALE